MSQLELLFQNRPSAPRPDPRAAWVEVGTRRLPLIFIRHPRARRYVLRLLADGAVCVTLPRRGTFAEANNFVRRHTSWLQRRLELAARRAASPSIWGAGTKILFRGDEVSLECVETGGLLTVKFAHETLNAPSPAMDLRPHVETHLRNLAAMELPKRLLELAAQHGFEVRKISVRNQRSRWGSCSRRGTISLNWRLIQTPPFVADYILLHELAHLRHMNHSARYWAEVARICPMWQAAESWLKRNRLL